MTSMAPRNDATTDFYRWFNTTRQNPEHEWSDAQRAAAAELYPSRIPDPANALDIHGKPVFDATFSHKYEVTEKEMSDVEKISWKQYQLFKATLKIDRRDSLYQAFATADFTNGSAAHNWLGAPFPVIEPRPTPGDNMYAIRWYEHLGCIALSLGFYAYIRAKPSVRYNVASIAAQRGMVWWTLVMCEMGMGHRAANRLRGCIENEYECERFGVLETPERLGEKAKYWERYRKYKEEWMRRYDYYVFGMRPGERFTLLSPCHFPPAAVLFNKRTDFKLRKNPFILSEHAVTPSELKTAFENMQSQSNMRPVKPFEHSRPEAKYYGPLGAWTKSDRNHGPTGVMFT
jgi:hypothetical protein